MDYDNDDRVLTVTYPMTRKTHFAYCINGNANCAANQVKTEYRAWQSGTGCTYGTTNQECYRRVTYYPNGEQKTIEDANNNITSYAYDNWVRPTTTTFPDSSTEVLTLDEDANVKARKTRAGGTINYGYNDLDWITTKTMPITAGTLDTSWTYRLNGKIDTLTDDAVGTGSNKLDYGYDSADRMTSTTTHIAEFNTDRLVSYVLDANGNRTKLTWPTNEAAYSVGYCYDNLNRMSKVTENPTGNDCTSSSTNLATYAYDPLSNRTGLTYGNGASETANFYVSAAPAHYSPDLQTLTHKMPTTGPAYTFGYTNAHQLNSEAISDATYLWQPSTNITTGYTVNNLNQYATVNTVPYGYDGNGNMTGDGTWTYNYDLENHLLTANKTAGGTVAATYAYDPLGRRTRKSGTGVTKTYILSDGTDEITEYDLNRVPLTRYIPGPSIDQPIAMVDYASGAHKYFHTNKQGSVIAMTDDTGAKVEGPYTYDPYGNCFSGASPCVTVAGSTAPYRFTGRRLDPETGLYYYRARYYASGDTNGGGRFLQTDPVGYSADLDLYTYAGNDPTDATDPTGKACEVLYFNVFSPYCFRSTKYAFEQIKFWNQTKFFAAASLTTAMLADTSGLGVAAVPASTRNFLLNVSEHLERYNDQMAAGLENGSIRGSGAALDHQLVHNEQTIVQSMLNQLKTGDPQTYKTVVAKINELLNGNLASVASHFTMVDNIYHSALSIVRSQIGRDIDFANQGDREAIGNELTRELRLQGGCTPTGSRIPTCKS
ncbi:MAG: RHS repeat-associated core domain-containing protein [Rhizomicrobium sp.]